MCAFQTHVRFNFPSLFFAGKLTEVSVQQKKPKNKNKNKNKYKKKLTQFSISSPLPFYLFETCSSP